MVHKMLDAMIGTGRDLFRTDQSAQSQEIDLLHKAAGIAEYFDFGVWPLEKSAGTESWMEDKSIYALPDLTKDERQWWSDGLIPLPAPVCWYEFKLPESKYRSGLLLAGGQNFKGVKGAKEGVEYMLGVMRVNYCKSNGDKSGYYFDGLLLGLDVRSLLDDNSEVLIKGNLELLRKLRETHGVRGANSMFYSSLMIGIYLTLMLNSRTTDVAMAVTPAKLVKAQLHRRETPLPNHRVVTIVPQRFRKELKVAGQGGHHLSPRLHWRRSHLRHFNHPTAGAKWMPAMEWNGKTGWYATVIARQLISRAEHGTLT